MLQKPHLSVAADPPEDRPYFKFVSTARDVKGCVFMFMFDPALGLVARASTVASLQALSAHALKNKDNTFTLY